MINAKRITIIKIAVLILRGMEEIFDIEKAQREKLKYKK